MWVALTGGEECGLEGMRAFTRAHKDELDPFKTIVLAIDSVGKGDVRWVTSEGLTISFEMDARVTQLCEAIAEADSAEENRYRAAPLRHGYITDALAARVGGLRASAISCLEPGAITPANHHTPQDVPAAIDPGAMKRAANFTLDLVRALDRDLARTRAREPEEPAPSPKAAIAQEAPALMSEKLWEPSAETVEGSNMTAYMRWLEAEQRPQLRRRLRPPLGTGPSPRSRTSGARSGTTSKSRPTATPRPSWQTRTCPARNGSPAPA